MGVPWRENSESVPKLRGSPSSMAGCKELAVPWAREVGSWGSPSLRGSRQWVVGKDPPSTAGRQGPPV